MIIEIGISDFDTKAGVELQKDTVSVVKIKSLIDKYNINEIEFLKIDTECNDCIILNNF